MKLETLEKDSYYHIYNRGVNREVIFRNDENKRYFLKLIQKYLSGKVGILAFCLMDNHYHMAVQIKEDGDMVIQAFSNLFNAYAKAFNKKYNRTGNLFEKHFRRKKIEDEAYLRNLIICIHTNPVKHGVCKNCASYEFSSYSTFINSDKTGGFPIEKELVLELFDDLPNMQYMHEQKHESAKTASDLQGFQNLVGQKIGFENLAGQEPDKAMRIKFYTYIQSLQDKITAALEELDGEATFREDIWDRSEGGGGRSRILENGAVFEKGGVNISAVYGALPESMQTYFKVKDADFYACGLSLVLHPKNPMVPTVHANWRYFEMYDEQGNNVDQWFGGGQDLTPYYLFDEDATHFHAICKKACDQHNPQFYKDFKARCDEYFWNTHRNEARGVGGLFFDYCRKTKGMSMQQWYNFVTEVGDSFLESYVPVVNKRKEMPYTKDQKTWQEIRRGRYVEFNLVHDKGTLFGLRTNGRTESILMSLPPTVQWKYDYHPGENTEEAQLIEVLQHPREWVKE